MKRYICTNYMLSSNDNNFGGFLPVSDNRHRLVRFFQMLDVLVGELDVNGS